jgi:hypothetical protein
MTTQPPEHDRWPWRRMAAALIVLGPCLFGFGGKFWELVQIVRGDVEGIFALTPIANYLLASFGFLLLCLWGASQGVFHDLEAPKYVMLEREKLLNELNDKIG